VPLTCGNTPVSFLRVSAQPGLFQVVWRHDGVSAVGIVHASVADAAIPAEVSSSFAPDLLGPGSALDPVAHNRRVRVSTSSASSRSKAAIASKKRSTSSRLLLARELEQDRPAEVPAQRRHVLEIPGGRSTEQREHLVGSEFFQRQQRNPRVPVDGAHAHVDREIDPALFVLRLDREASERVRRDLAPPLDPASLSARSTAATIVAIVSASASA
jgi:hypothetical protein